MNKRFAAITLIFMAFIGLGMLTASAQYPSNQEASTAPAGTSAAGTYSQDYQQGMLQGLRMGFTMQALLCSAQFNESAAQEYNSRVESFNQMITDVFGSSASQEMFLQPLDMTQLQQTYAAQRQAAAQA